MKSFISIFEIPVIDLPRAIQFYQSLLNIKIEAIEMPGTQMGVFPSEEQMVSGVLLKSEGYHPSPDGVLLYFNGGDDLQLLLDKVEHSNGKIIVPKTIIAEEMGYFAHFIDSEGNRIGLHSPN